MKIEAFPIFQPQPKPVQSKKTRKIISFLLS